ncbi:MAG: DUF2723 domain-containing protein [Chryseobacterium sp.]|nr:MAG: DUF2723 domain-containing protein [Chryseobacterium sp.]
MRNRTFGKWNNVLGWAIFVVAAWTYLSTIEPNFSFWDCAEYISSAVKLQVTHAPGAALFQLVGAVVGMLAFGQGHYYSLVINGMSAVFSALTVLFLFWTITHLLRRMIAETPEATEAKKYILLFAGAVGALCFAFSDTFWFSAVEGEVYAMASLFIALLLWLICKWEEQHDTPGNQRWIILIFFVTGLSVGVHMMAMLTIPAVCLIYYARRYEFTWKSFAIANLVTLLILAVVFKGIFPLIMTIFGKSEILFVNGFGLPFHSGTIFAFILLILAAYFILKFTSRSGSALYNTIALSAVYMIIGFGCWMMIPIRATANPPMNLNDPDNAIGMLDYYNREQYGDWPTTYGQNYTAHLDADGIERNADGSYKTVVKGEIYEKNETTGRYDEVGKRENYVYNPRHVSFLPRMFNSDRDVMGNYIKMYGAPDFSFNYSNPDVADNPEAQRVFEDLRSKFDDGSISVDDYLQVKPYNLINVQRPSLAQNLDYFFSFQNGYYFVRYLMWNFVGRQNDLEGHMENNRGNWISGIPFVDNMMWGDQSKLPAKYRNESTVAFYFLPLLLGLAGFFYQLNYDFKRFYAILSLFIITSVGIIFYTGVKPFEPRERDYAMVGSFYAFAIWIGLGAAAVLYLVQQKLKNQKAIVALGVVLLGVPFMMGFQNYNPHDRSGRYTAYDFAYSALKSLPKNDILFVYGDNDTYPVWGIQETENFRDDVKVVNFTLMATPWNIDQIRRRTYNAMGVPSSMTHEHYREGANDQVYLMTSDDWQALFENLAEAGAPPTAFAQFRKYITQDFMTLKDAMNFLKTHSEEKDELMKMLFRQDDVSRFNLLPVNKLVLPVNVNNAVKAGIIKPQDAALAEKQILIEYGKSSLLKNDLVMMDILANFDWNRPISFSVGGVYDPSNVFYLQDYLQFDGFTYRLVPIRTPEDETSNTGRVDADDLYNIVKNYRWGNFKDLKVHFDETATSNIISYRLSASRAAEALIAKGERGKAIELLDLAMQEIPIEKYNDPRTLNEMAYAYLLAGQEKKALDLADLLLKNTLEEYDYYASLKPADQRYARKQMGQLPMQYAMVTGSVTAAYDKLGRKDKAYDYLLKVMQPLDKRYDAFIKNLQMMGREKAYNESEAVQRILPFYQYLFGVMKPYDSTFAGEKMEQITRQIMQATQ